MFWIGRSNENKRNGPPKAVNNEPTRKRLKVCDPSTRQDEEDIDDRSSYKGKDKEYINSDESKIQVSNGSETNIEEFRSDDDTESEDDNDYGNDITEDKKKRKAPSTISIRSKISDLTSYDPSVDLSAALIQGQNGLNLVLKSIIRDKLFPKVKFIKKECDLVFDTNSKTICGSILKWLNLRKKPTEYQYKFWFANQHNVDKFLTQHRNNKIKKFKRHMERYLAEFPEYTFMIEKLREADDVTLYMETLSQFSIVIYNETAILQRAKTENISTLLTPSDEAFILLLIIVYYEKHADTKFEDFEKKVYVERTGWQEAGIHLYNSIYKQVKEDRDLNGEKFDIAFRKYYLSKSDMNNVETKRNKKKNMPIALNDLD